MKALVALCASMAVLAACSEKKEEPAPPSADQATATPSTPPVATPDESATSANVQLAATQGHTVTGSISIVPMGAGVHLTGSLQGLAPNGEFGFHIHEKGDCSAPDASSAGGHFNPANVDHGNPQSLPHHAGDMMNAKSDAQGMAQINVHVDGLSLGDGGANDVIGKAVVVHEKADDYKTQPSGGSGARVACGVITAGGM